MAQQKFRSVPPPRSDTPRRQADLPVVDSPQTQPGEQRPEQKQRRRRPWRRWIRRGLFALLPIALALGAYWYVTGGQVMSTDNAYVNANRVGISTDVPGIVKTVEVRNNQHVRRGQVLYRLDPLQFQIAVDNAKANLEQTALNLDAMKQDYVRMQHDAQAQQAQVNLDQVNYNRAKFLLSTGTAAKANYDQANYTLHNAQSRLQSLQQQVKVQLARLHATASNPMLTNPVIAHAWSPFTAAGRAALDVMIGDQASIIAYMNNYKLLLIATLAALPSLIVFKRPRRTEGGAHVIIE